MSNNNLSIVEESAGLHGFEYCNGGTITGDYSFLVVEEAGVCEAVSRAGDDLRSAEREQGAPIAGCFKSVTADSDCWVRCYLSRNK